MGPAYPKAKADTCPRSVLLRSASAWRVHTRISQPISCRGTYGGSRSSRLFLHLHPRTGRRGTARAETGPCTLSPQGTRHKSPAAPQTIEEHIRESGKFPKSPLNPLCLCKTQDQYRLWHRPEHTFAWPSQFQSLDSDRGRKGAAPTSQGQHATPKCPVTHVTSKRCRPVRVFYCAGTEVLNLSPRPQAPWWPHRFPGLHVTWRGTLCLAHPTPVVTV